MEKSEKQFFKIGFKLLEELVKSQRSVRINDNITYTFFQDTEIIEDFLIIEENLITKEQNWIYDSLSNYNYYGSNFEFPFESNSLNSNFINDLVGDSDIVKVKLFEDSPSEYWLTKLPIMPIISERTYGVRKELACFGAICCNGFNIIYASDTNTEHILTDLEYLKMLDLPSNDEEMIYYEQLQKWD